MNLADSSAADGRPSPEALLDSASREGRGRLKIFLGAAPGVGKTYEMLQAAHRRQGEGVDVIAGVVETHGRAETGALLAGLEVLPRRIVEHRGHALEEMDLDAILARKPGLVLVDELAHSNAPGSRHPKRYLDVEELLAAGIDVHTTLNIQHVESLNDVVAQITRVRVRETVPDAILDRADDIEIIDISPADLIQRLKEGKVYVPEQAARAVDGYFSPGNLTALRELALRRTAERVDEQLLAHMQTHAIAGPWAAGERVLVCVSEDPRSAALVRYAKRTADRLHAPWTAVHVETSRSQGLGEPQRNRIAETLRLAESLGGEVAHLPGSVRIADDVLGFARANNVTQIIIGKSDRSRWFELLNGSVVHDLVRKAGSISVHVMAGEPATQVEPASASRSTRDGSPGPYLIAAAAVALCVPVGKLVQPLVGVETIDLIFLVTVLGVAATFGLLQSLFASVLASLAYNFFFLPPLYTFAIASPANVAAFGFFLLVAVIVSNLAARVRSQMMTARHRARTTEALYAFSRKIAAVAMLDDLLWAAAFQIASMLRLDVVFLIPGRAGLEVRTAYPPEDELDEADLGAAKWAFESKRPAGRGSDTLAGARRLFLPIATAAGILGLVGLTRAQPGPLVTPGERRLLDALIDQIAVALERLQLARSMDEARIATETERLRSALLTSLSHDLKTPLASITGAATSLRDYGEIYSAEERADLVGVIASESSRLARFVVNLLDMTRLESGPIELRREPVDVGEVIATAIDHAAAVLGSRHVTVEVPPDMPLLSLDVVLFEQVLVNLLENAGRYTPPDSRVVIRAAHSQNGATIEVKDSGPGIAPADLERIFDKFQRADAGDRRPPGTGLGLAIARGFVEALGGTTAAGNRRDGSGAVFTIAFPAGLLLADPPVPEVV